MEVEVCEENVSLEEELELTPAHCVGRRNAVRPKILFYRAACLTRTPVGLSIRRARIRKAIAIKPTWCKSTAMQF